jgi:DNA polymerase-3 subunit gamma/tau
MERELYLKHRPKTWRRVIGQPEAVAMLQSMVSHNRVKHAVMFTGPSGCGKTTLARILKTKLHCHPMDAKEFNCADFRGIDTIRAIRRGINFQPIGDSTVIIIDEAHQLSYDAQQAFLKLLEDTPDHVYFFLCTTNPEKLADTIHTRCTEIKTKFLSPKETEQVVTHVCHAERQKKPTTEVMDALVEAADGSARKALVILDQVLYLKSPKQQLRAVIAADSKMQANKIFQLLMAYKPGWPKLASVLKLVGDDPEKVRHYVLAAAGNVMLSGSKAAGKADKIIQAFRDPFYDSKRAGLISACFEVVNG